MMWNMQGPPFCQWGSAAPTKSPSNFLHTPNLLIWWGGGKMQKRPRLCVCTAIANHPYIINAVSSTNSKQSPVLATVKKIISAKISI